MTSASPISPELPEGAPERPALAFRVGVTGARVLAKDAPPALRREIEAILRAIAAQARAAASDPKARDLYRTEPDGRVIPRLRALSPLADGADRLFAEVALELGYELDVALPFARDEYANDFDDAGRGAFERLLEGRACLEIDGGRERESRDDENRSYEAVGRLVVRNCDLLVAVWDGRPAKGRGGTGDIVRFAARVGPPVWWLDAAGAAPPRLVRTMADLRSPEDMPSDAAARALLAQTIEEALFPPPVGRHHHHLHGIVGGVAHRIGLRSHARTEPLRTYLKETRRPRRWRWWETHARFFRLVAGPPDYPNQAPVDSGTFWERHYRCADAVSVDYRDRYRSSYVLIFGGATLAVACAVVPLAFETLEQLLAPLELVLLGAIMALVFFNQRRDWQGRWIAYRLLAELCRKQEALAQLGYSLPASDLRKMHASAASPQWVGWYFNALLRAAPLATGRLSAELPRIRDLIRAKVVAGQAGYHRERRRRSEIAALRLSKYGELAFLATFAVAVAKLLLLCLAPHEPSRLAIAVLGSAAAILPAISAALFGIRAYAELELLEQQSTRMEKTMVDAGARIDRLRLDRPLASQDLAAEVFDLSAEMLQDVGGWASLFQLKPVEVG